jgi:hypothetical protein
MAKTTRCARAVVSEDESKSTGPKISVPVLLTLFSCSEHYSQMVPYLYRGMW